MYCMNPLKSLQGAKTFLDLQIEFPPLWVMSILGATSKKKVLLLAERSAKARPSPNLNGVFPKSPKFVVLAQGPI